jgi:cation diffusion facilitator family transporter
VTNNDRRPYRQRQNLLRRAAWGGIAGNLLLSVIKGVAGVLGNSKALIADAFHSASDVISSVVVLVGIKAASKPPDHDHPYGHGKAELVAAIIVSVLLAVVGIELIIHTGYSFLAPPEVPSGWVIYIILFSILAKEALYQVKNRIGGRMHSQALIADAWHHRSDALSSIAVLAGVGAALMAETLQMEWLIYADPAAGLLIAGMILKMAWNIGYEAVHKTLDHTLHKEDTETMRQKVFEIDGVKSIDSFRAREHGHYIIVDIKISVPSDLSVEEGHTISKRVKDELMKIENIEDVLVHVNPYEKSAEPKQ